MNEVAETKFQVASFVIHQQQRVSSISVRKTVLISIALLVFFNWEHESVLDGGDVSSPLFYSAQGRETLKPIGRKSAITKLDILKKGEKREITSSELMPSPFFRTCPFLPHAK